LYDSASVPLHFVDTPWGYREGLVL
jgi:hypothetical protein